ncbi:MAG: hypothetical protein CMP23_01725 [Rickettsiales bacterium]|nr:hypothetical protein [Rickettsiales bacterium]|tara:strand:- start:1968 stop:2513 length:546 start_codon:yes stop_codon:yes gene_type:complete
MAKTSLTIVFIAGLLTALTGCPPDREQAAGSHQLPSALFLSVYYPTLQATAASLLLPREEGLDCDINYDLADDDEDFLLVALVKGDLHDWLGSYVANEADPELCSVTGDDSYDLQDQRCLTKLSGIDLAGTTLTLTDDTRLNLVRHDQSGVSGTIRSGPDHLETFTANHCGERLQFAADPN